jgi:hypothetical protein
MKNTDLEFAIQSVGGTAEAARICSRSYMAVSKWIKQGHLPRTEYTGESKYAELLSILLSLLLCVPDTLLL